MCSKGLLLLACLGLLGGLRLTSTTTTTTFVAAMSIGNQQDLERYFRSANASQTTTSVSEDRIAMDIFTYAFLKYSYTMNEAGEVNVGWNDEKGRYGEGKILNVTGKLVHIRATEDANDDTACSSNIQGTLGNPTPAAGVTWIALVRRGRCTFEEKVKNVYGKGAKGVIIYNDKPVMNLEKMQIKGKDRDITAVITYQEIGLDMAQILDQGIDVEATITSGRSGMRPISTLNRTSVLFVSISFIVLMVISLVWLIFYYIQRFRYLQTKDQQSRHLCSVTKKAIMKIPTKTGKSSDEKDAESDCCAICIETYKASDCIRVLPCKHEFHKNCIDPWLIEHRTCPMCKLDVLKFYGYVFLGSEESILEYEPDRRVDAATAASSGATAVAVGAGPSRAGALSDLIRSRDFVIDFPRIFVLDAGGAVGSRESLFPNRLPERSQSSLSLANTNDWMSAVTNKLDEQHGLSRLRKTSTRYDMQENLLGVRTDSVRTRRSRSADGRYSSGFFGRKELTRQLAETTKSSADTSVPPRRGSAVLRGLTDATYAQSTWRQKQHFDLANLARRRRSSLNGEGVNIPLGEISSQSTPPRAAPVRNDNRELSPPDDVSITIQVNGEGIDFE